MSDSTPERPMDKRLVERFIRKGELKRSELDKHLAGLKDVAEHGDNLDVEALLKEIQGHARR